ncbi:MAG: hypothetical protein V3S22_02910 [Candidatus Neomarinimicrobiota bacterium]
MQKALTTITKWIGDITDFLKMLIVLGVLVGVLFNDYFGVIGGIGELMGKFGDGGFAGLLALILLVMWYKK